MLRINIISQGGGRDRARYQLFPPLLAAPVLVWLRDGSGSLMEGSNAKGVSHSLGSIFSMKGRRAPTVASLLIQLGMSLLHRI